MKSTKDNQPIYRESKQKGLCKANTARLTKQYYLFLIINGHLPLLAQSILQTGKLDVMLMPNLRW